MTDIIFSFDTEDYVNPRGAEGILRSAQLLREYGYKGCFNVVGLMASALVEWGRDDVVRELKQYHEIECHSHRHSMHPTINEYTDRADYAGAYRDFMLDEKEGIRKIREVFGVDDMYAACPPGNSTSYVAHYAYADLGFPLYDGDELFDAVQSRPISACNILCVRYEQALEEMLFTATEESLRRFLEEDVATKGSYVIYHHPQRAYYHTFWDEDNFHGHNTPKEQWKEGRRCSDEEVETFYRNFRLLLDLIRKDPRFRVITYRDLAEQYAPSVVRTLPKEFLGQLRDQMEEDFFPVTLPDSYCIADVFHACRAFLCGETEHECGKVYGFLEKPYAISEEVTVSATEMIASAKKISADGFLPEFLYVNDKKLGPADWLRAAFAVLLDGAEEVTLKPGPWQIDLDQFPALRDLTYYHNWIHCDSLEDRYLTDRFRLQSWTFRLPKGTDRKIFPEK